MSRSLNFWLGFKQISSIWLSKKRFWSIFYPKKFNVTTFPNFVFTISAHVLTLIQKLASSIYPYLTSCNYFPIKISLFPSISLLFLDLFQLTDYQYKASHCRLNYKYKCLLRKRGGPSNKWKTAMVLRNVVRR